jgi:predicted DNA-binding transcriptional regulator YafY
MYSTTNRHLMLLQLIPQAPRSTTAKHLVQALADRGIRVTVRSVQHDLNALSVCFPLILDATDREFRWSFAKDANVSMVPAAQPAGTLAVQPPGMESRASASFQVHLRCDRPELECLCDRPIGPDQRLIREDAEALELYVSMPDTEDTRRWLLAHAQHCEVLAPGALRAEIRARLQAAVRRLAG